MTDQSTTERIAELERKNAELVEALQDVIEPGCDCDSCNKARDVLASHHKEDKA